MKYKLLKKKCLRLTKLSKCIIHNELCILFRKKSAKIPMIYEARERSK